MQQLHQFCVFFVEAGEGVSWESFEDIEDEFGSDKLDGFCDNGSIGSDASRAGTPPLDGGCCGFPAESTAVRYAAIKSNKNVGS